jgi:hypothetical protein
MAARRREFELDETISLGDRLTIIRQEFDNGTAVKLRESEVQARIESAEPSTRVHLHDTAIIEMDEKSPAEIPITEAAHRELMKLKE